MPEISQSFFGGAQLGNQMAVQARNAGLALRGQQLQERELWMRDEQQRIENDPGSLRNRFLGAQTRLMNFQADMAEASQSYVLAKNAAEADKLKRTMQIQAELDFMSPEYAEVFQRERTAAYDAFNTDKPYVPGKHISAYLAARGGKNGIAAIDERFIAMQDALNKEIDQQLKLNPRAFEFQAKYRQYEQLLAEDPEKAEKFKALAFPAGRQTSMTFDPVTGTMTVTEGNGPTAAIQTKATEQAIGALNMGRLINEVIPKVDASTVGLGGVLGRVIDASLVSDVFPTMFNKKRAEVFQELGMLRAEATKMLRSDSQIAEGERKAIEALLPKVSAASSVPLVRQQLFEIRSHIGKGKREWLEQAKKPVPPEFWTQEEIISAAKQREAKGEFADYAAKMKWVNDAMFSSLYPNQFNTDYAKFQQYAPRAQ
jgi:predicted pyridoxine 5'-phosphate oxidase superfamily flavin-nucleotide-binding protein